MPSNLVEQARFVSETPSRRIQLYNIYYECKKESDTAWHKLMEFV